MIGCWIQPFCPYPSLTPATFYPPSTRNRRVQPDLEITGSVDGGGIGGGSIDGRWFRWNLYSNGQPFNVDAGLYAGPRCGVKRAKLPTD